MERWLTNSSWAPPTHQALSRALDRTNKSRCLVLPDRRLVREGAGHGGGAEEGLASRGVRRAQASETPPHPQAAADTQERPAGEGALFLAQMLSGALLFLTQTRRPSGMKSAEIVGQGPGGQAWGRESFLPAELVWGP